MCRLHNFDFHFPFFFECVMVNFMFWCVSLSIIKNVFCSLYLMLNNLNHITVKHNNFCDEKYVREHFTKTTIFISILLSCCLSHSYFAYCVDFVFGFVLGEIFVPRGAIFWGALTMPAFLRGSIETQHSSSVQYLTLRDIWMV